jgi:hypothetical protein
MCYWLGARKRLDGRGTQASFQANGLLKNPSPSSPGRTSGTLEFAVVIYPPAKSFLAIWPQRSHRDSLPWNNFASASRTALNARDGDLIAVCDCFKDPEAPVPLQTLSHDFFSDSPKQRT